MSEKTSTQAITIAVSERQREQVIIAAAVEQFQAERFGDGDVISHHWLQTYLDIPDPDSDPQEDDPEQRRRLLLADAKRVQFLLLSRVEEFKKRLLEEHRIALESVRGIGYRIVPPDEQALFAVCQGGQLIRKGLDTMHTLLANARTEVMSNDARRRHLDAQVKAQGIKMIVTREKRDVFALFDNK